MKKTRKTPQTRDHAPPSYYAVKDGLTKDAADSQHAVLPIEKMRRSFLHFFVHTQTSKVRSLLKWQVYSQMTKRKKKKTAAGSSSCFWTPLREEPLHVPIPINFQQSLKPQATLNLQVTSFWAVFTGKPATTRQPCTPTEHFSFTHLMQIEICLRKRRTNKRKQIAKYNAISICDC